MARWATRLGPLRLTNWGRVVLCAFALVTAVGSGGDRTTGPDAPQWPSASLVPFRRSVGRESTRLPPTRRVGRSWTSRRESSNSSTRVRVKTSPSSQPCPLPIQAPRPPVLRDVASNAFAEDGRLFVLVLDDIHSYRVTTPVIKAAARRLVERLSPQDLVAVLWMSTNKKGAFEFTANHGAVLDAIDGFAASKDAGGTVRRALVRGLGCQGPGRSGPLLAAEAL